MSAPSRSRAPADAVSVELQVPFHDTGDGQFVWHGHFVKYFEIARQELLKRHRLDVPQLMELGIKLMVSQYRLRYLSPLSYGDRFRVSSWLVEQKVRLEFAYEVYDLTADRVSAEGETVLVVVGEDEVARLRIPDEVRARLAAP
jgi:acyl-CoA thioester hydrolase